MQAKSISAACAMAVYDCWMLLILFVADCDGSNNHNASNSLVFMVKKHCIPDPENRKSEDIVFRYHDGCTVRLTCYRFACAGKPGHLVINPVDTDIQVEKVEVSRRPSECLVEVELRNMTKSSSGSYNCKNNNTEETATALEMKFSQLNFLVRQRCPSGKNNWVTQTQTAYVHRGCKITLTCRYSDLNSHCHQKEFIPKLTVSAQHNVTLHSRTKNYTLTQAKIRRINVSYEGYYRCRDEACGDESEQLHLRVGSPPSPPRNLTVIYRPRMSLRVLFNKFKTGEDLNDLTANWTVEYLWRRTPVKCSPVNNQMDLGLYIACHINMTNRYLGYGHYDGLGSVYNIVHVRVDVNSVFGNLNVNGEFYVPHYVEPDSFYNVSVEDTGPTWIQLRVSLPSGLDRHTCNLMDKDSALRIHYKAKNLEEKEQLSRRPDTNHFHTNYSFYRNLQDDKEALKSLLLGNVSLEQTGTVMWAKTCDESVVVNITDLQPFTFYNITLTPLARYKGPSYSLTPPVNTNESVPLEGPRFDQNFYTCLTSCKTAPEYVKCYIYFREIPRPLRGGTIQNYTLQGTKSDWHKVDFRVSVDGQDNFFVLENLTRNATYHIELQAFAESGPSPVTNSSLTTSLSPGPDKAVVVREKLDDNVWNYKVTWEPQAPIDDYNVHYCFASGKLNCTTNMVKNKVTKNDSLDIGDAGDLQPFFFVSWKSAATPHSLTPVSYHYETEKSPDSPELYVTVHNNSLHLKMKPKCQADDLYIYGQPKQFCYAYMNTDNCSICPVTNEACVDAGDEVTRHLTLKPNSTYCVSVSARSATGQVSKWACQIERTQGVDVGILSPVAVEFTPIIVAVAAAACIFVCIFVCFRCSRRYRKIQSRLNPQTSESPQPRLPQPHRPKTKHIPWPIGETSLHCTAGIQNQRRIKTDHIVSFMNEQATASACTSPRPADAGVSHRPAVPTRYASAPLPLHVFDHTLYRTDKDSTERSKGESTQDGPDIDNDDDCRSYAYDSELSASSADLSESQSSDSLDQETDHDKEVGEGRDVGPARFIEGNDEDGDIRIVGDKGDRHEVQERQEEWLEDMENWPMCDHDDDPVVIASKISCTLTAAQTLKTCSSGHNGLLCASNDDEVADLERGNISETLSTHHSVKTHHVNTQEHCDTPQHQSVDDQSLGENTDSSWNLKERLFPGAGAVSDCVSETSHTDNNNIKQVEEAKRGCTDSESVRSGSCTGCGRPWAETQNHVLSDAKTITCSCKGVENCQHGVITDHSVVSVDGTGVPSPLTRKLSDSQKGTNAALNSHFSKDEPKFSHKSHILVQGRCQNSLAPKAPSYSGTTFEPTRSSLPPQPHKASDTTAGSCDVTNMYDDLDLEEVSESSELLPTLCNGSSENVGLKHAEKAQFLPNHLRSSNYLKIHSNDVSS